MGHWSDGDTLTASAVPPRLEEEPLHKRGRGGGRPEFSRWDCFLCRGDTAGPATSYEHLVEAPVAEEVSLGHGPPWRASEGRGWLPAALSYHFMAP